MTNSLKVIIFNIALDSHLNFDMTLT